jgi:hypothetical protein
VDDRIQAKLAYARDLKKYTASKMAEKLKSKYAPKPSEPAAPEQPADEDVDLSGLDDATIQSLIGE